jgi:hypothetical protein
MAVISPSVVEEVQAGERVHAVAQDAGTEAHRDVPGVGDDDAAPRGSQFRSSSTGSAGRRAGVAAEELLGQRRQQGVTARLNLGVGLRQAGHEDVEQRAEVVAAFEQDRRQFAADRNLAVAQLVENVLDLVREGFDEVALDDAGTALDGVRGAEDGAEIVGVVGRLLELEQSVFHRQQLVAALGDEGTGQFVHRVCSSFVRVRDGDVRCWPG